MLLFNGVPTLMLHAQHKAPEQENASGTPGEEKAAGAAEVR